MLDNDKKVRTEEVTYVANHFGIVVLNDGRADFIYSWRKVYSCWVDCASCIFASTTSATARDGLVNGIGIIGNTVTCE